MSQDGLKVDGNVYCSLHHRPIRIFSEYNYAYLVEKRADKFFYRQNVICGVNPSLAIRLYS